MKRIHSLIQLGKAQTSVESNADDAAVVTQPVEGQPTVASTSDVLAAEQQSTAAQQQADEQTPADGSIPSTEVPGVATESGGEAGVVAPVATETNPELDNKVDTGDGSQPATAGDVIDNKDARADLGTPVVASQESQEAGVVAPVATETKPELDGKVDTGDGSQPATPSDQPGDAGKRADEGKANATAPAELAPELEQVVVKAPQVTSVAADPNDPDKDGKSGEGKATPEQTTSTEKSEQTGGAAPANTTSTEQSAVEGGKPSTEDLSPADIAQVASVAAAVGAATSGGAAPTEAVAEAVADEGAIAGSAGAGTPPPAEIPAEPAGTPAAADAAAQTAADGVAQGPTGDTPPGPNAGEAAATPAEAAQVAADLIKANPETAAEVAQAIDTVADAAVAATQGTEAPTDDQTAQGEAQAAAADNANADQLNPDADAEAQAAADAEFEESTDEREELDDEIDEDDEIADDTEVSQESLLSSRRLLAALESQVEVALANGGLSNDAAQMLQTVTSHVGNDQELDDTDLGLESLEYADRRNATNYALSRLRYAGEQLEEELTVSSEGLFDLFKSANTKNREWVAKARRNIQAAKSGITDRKKTANVNVPGLRDGEGIVDGADRSARMLAGILDGYFKNVDTCATNLSRAAEKLRDGSQNYDDAIEDLGDINIPVPAGMKQERGFYVSGPLMGGVELQLNLSGSKSGANIRSVRDSASVDITGDNAMVILTDAEKLVKFMENAQEQFDAIEKALSNSKSEGGGKAIAYAMIFSYFAILSPDFRRRIYRAFNSDHQQDKAGEIKAAFDLVKNAMKAGRKWVDTAVSISSQVTG